MQTIKRDPEWPKWAEYKTIDRYGYEELWSAHPRKDCYTWLRASTDDYHCVICDKGGKWIREWEHLIWKIEDCDILSIAEESPCIDDNINDAMRTFETGATRNRDDNKLDYEGFLSPIVLQEFAKYMHANRVQADGKIRDSDNWQKGIPVEAYMESMMRHFMSVWLLHRGCEAFDENGKSVKMMDSLMGVLFNVQGYAFELLRKDNKR